MNVMNATMNQLGTIQITYVYDDDDNRTYRVPGSTTNIMARARRFRTLAHPTSTAIVLSRDGKHLMTTPHDDGVLSVWIDARPFADDHALPFDCR